MQLQVDKALERGIDAHLWNSQVSDQQRSRAISEVTCSEPEMKLLYTTPESLRNPRLREALKVCPCHLLLGYCSLLPRATYLLL